MSRALFLAALLFAAPAQAETRFFSDIADVPLPPGFTQSEPGASFESEQGRIVTAEARGDADALTVRDFYYETMPQLGWGMSVEEGALVFVRGRERLHFFVERVDGGLSLRAQLAVGAAAMD